MTDDKITFEQFSDPAFRRSLQMKVKTEAVWLAFLELDGMVNVSKFARRYMGKSQSWFAQKLYGTTVGGRERRFTAEECAAIASALRSLAGQLSAAADSIDRAEP